MCESLEMTNPDLMFRILDPMGVEVEYLEALPFLSELTVFVIIS